jgi:hypothetical protein
MKRLGELYESQSLLGRALGVEQQSVGRLLRDRRAGFAYTTATRVVQLMGFRSVDAFFAARGLAGSVVTEMNDALQRQSA